MNYGFRPFFLLAGVYAALAIPGWMALLHGVGWAGSPLAPLAWHAHEMIYGFVMAGVAGFLLTAVPSWTGQRGFAGLPLATLVLIWIAGRAVITFPLGLGSHIIAAIDLAFPIALALTIIPSLLRSGNHRNFVFVVLLALLFVANLDFHISGAGSTEALHLAVNTLLLLVTLIGGRIVPSFTSARLKQRGLDVRIPRSRLLDGAAVPAVGAVLVVDVFAPNGTTAGMAATLASLVLGLRLIRWQGHRTPGEPLLWVLHVGYAWLPVALGLKAAWLLGGFAPAAWLHGLTAGAFATMMLGVMSRAALGHTGRPLTPPAGTVVAYGLLTGSAIVRVFGPALLPGGSLFWLDAAAALWTAAFVVFVFIYAPILWRPRIDGRSG